MLKKEAFDMLTAELEMQLNESEYTTKDTFQTRATNKNTRLRIKLKGSSFFLIFMSFFTCQRRKEL